MILLKPLEWTYSSVVNVKNFFYDYGFLKSISLNIPVISIGNLSVGGTGKTPCVAMVANELLKNKKVVIVSKSYKGNLKAPRRVDLTVTSPWSVFGDEACLLQKMLPECLVWSGPNKSDTAMAALADRPDVILVDDGFSHRRLKRDIDLVLIDATRGIEHMQSLPTGRLRESMSNLRRANVVILTKTNLTAQEQVERITHFILKEEPSLKENLFYATSENKLDLDNQSELFVFSGLGNPESFLTALKKMNFKVVDHLTFEDHQNYTISDQKKILDRYMQLKIKYANMKIVTTPKDALKITSPDLKSILKVAENKMVLLESQKEIFFEKFSKIF